MRASIQKSSQKKRSISKHKSNPTSKPILVQVDTCPDTSRSKIDIQPMYTHNLNFDYGHLQKPIIDYEDLKRQKIINKLSQRKSTDIKNGYKYNTDQKHKIHLSIDPKTQRTKNTKNIQNLNTTLKKNPQNISNKKNNIIMRLKNIHILQERSQKCKYHSRIIKMMVGGSKPQTKIINYPDNSDYLKLCGLR